MRVVARTFGVGLRVFTVEGHRMLSYYDEYRTRFHKCMEGIMIIDNVTQDEDLI